MAASWARVVSMLLPRTVGVGLEPRVEQSKRCGARSNSAGGSGRFLRGLTVRAASEAAFRPRRASSGKNGVLGGVRVILYSHFPVKCDRARVQMDMGSGLAPFASILGRSPPAQLLLAGPANWPRGRSGSGVAEVRRSPETGNPKPSGERGRSGTRTSPGPPPGPGSRLRICRHRSS